MMIPRLYLLLLCAGFLFPSSCVQAQDTLAFVPGFSSLVVKRGQLEYAGFASYLIGAKIYNLYAPYEFQGQQHVIVSGLQLTYGLSPRRPGAMFNAGMDMEAVFPGDTLRLYRIRPRLRWTPLAAGIHGFNIVLQHHISIPLHGQDSMSIPFQDLELRFANQLIVSKRFASDLILQGQLDLTILPKGPEDDLIPTTVGYFLYAGYIFRRNWVPYTSLSRVSEQGDVPWMPDDKRYRRRDAVLWGLGLQYAITADLQVFGGINLLLAQERGGGAHTLHAGIRGLIR